MCGDIPTHYFLAWEFVWGGFAWSVIQGCILAGIGPKYIQYDPWGILDYSMTQPDVQEATIRPFWVGIGQKYSQNAHWWILNKITTNRPIWPKLERNVSKMTIPEMCSTIPWHNPTYKGTYLTHLSVQRGDYWTIFGRDWTEIYSTWSLVIVRQNHDPSGRTRGHCLTIFFLEIGRK